ncbi:MAG: YceI family protein [Planctomycetota bacterium]
MRLNRTLCGVGMIGTGAAALAAVVATAGLGAGPATASSAPAPAESVALGTTSYQLDSVHSGVIFKITHAGAAPFYGMFHGISGSMTMDDASPANSQLSVTINTDSVATGNADRDGHLRAADFFNVRQFPTSTFTASNFRTSGNGGWTVEGKLTLLGQTKPVSATLTHTGEGEFRGKRSGYEARLSFDRSDFGMTKYIQEGVLGDRVDLIVFFQGIEQ